MPSFTKTHAEDFAKKLKRKPADQHLPRLEVREVKDGPHVIQQIWCEGKFAYSFGIKHGSNRNASHGWVARDLSIRPHDAYEFAVCNITIDTMIRMFVDKGDIEMPADKSDDGQ